MERRPRGRLLSRVRSDRFQFLRRERLPSSALVRASGCAPDEADQSSRTRTPRTCRCVSIRRGGESSHLEKLRSPTDCAPEKIHNLARTYNSNTRAGNGGGRRMKRWEFALAIGGAICLILGANWIRRGELPRQDFTLDAGGCRLPVTVFDPPADVSPAGTAVVLHGLSANRRVMTYLGEDLAGHGLRAYLFDLPGH